MENFKILFVYGTLKSDCRGHYMLAQSKYLGRAFSAPDYELWGGFTYPALIHAKGSGTTVEGELYLVDKETVAALDIYEGVEYGLYKFEKIQLSCREIDDPAEQVEDIYSYFYYGNMKNFRKIEKWTCS